MCDDNRCCAVDDCIAEYFSGVCQNTVERTYGDSTLRNKALAAIKRETYAIFLLLITNIGQSCQDIFLCSERLDIFYKVSPGNLERCQEFACSCDANAFYRSEFFKTEVLGSFCEYFLYLAS